MIPTSHRPEATITPRASKQWVKEVALAEMRFVEKVDYITSPGYLTGGDARSKYNFYGDGPALIVTSLGMMRPDPVTKEFILTEYFAFSSVEEVKENTGWDLKVAPDVRVVPEPTEQELANLRAVDETGMLRRKG